MITPTSPLSPNDSTIDKQCLKNVVEGISRRHADDLRVGEQPEEKPGEVILRASNLWLGRVRRQAQRLGLSFADYVRQALIRQLAADEAEDGTLRGNQPNR